MPYLGTFACQSDGSFRAFDAANSFLFGLPSIKSQKPRISAVSRQVGDNAVDLTSTKKLFIHGRVEERVVHQFDCC